MTHCDLTGLVFGSLTVLDFAQSKNTGRSTRNRWLCRCVCGRELEEYASVLAKRRTPQCACAKRDAKRPIGEEHGLSSLPEHRIWVGIRKRCNNPKVDCYDSYGGRGILVCEDWGSFSKFLADMGPRPSEIHSVERRDVNGPYSKDNCYWATPLEQSNNKRNNRRLEYDGRTQTLTQWAREAGIHPDAFELRINRLKWPMDKAVNTPPRGWGPGQPKRLVRSA